jgi:uncharacterized protein (TIGR02147 family)
MPDIFKYTDFKKFLKYTFKDLKKRNPRFGFRHIARELGHRTPSHIFLIVQGKRSLTNTMSLRITKFLGLKRKETYYFEHMVNFQQAKEKWEKDEYYYRMASLNSRLKKKRS